MEHPEDEIRAAVAGLLNPAVHGRAFPPLIVPIPTLTNLPIYRITPLGRDLVKQQQGRQSG